MTSKERAKLKSIASNMDAILQIGKNPIGDTFLKQVKDALKAREMIKIHVLETCELTPSETASALAEAAGCEVVQVIGGKVILFKRRAKGDKKGSYLDSEKNWQDTKKNGGERAKAGAPKGREDKNKASPPKKAGSYYVNRVGKSGGYGGNKSGYKSKRAVKK